MSVLNRNKQILVDRNAGKSYTVLAQKYDLPQSSLRRIVSETRRLALPSSPSPSAVERPENQNTDHDKWEQHFNALLKRKRFITVMHLSDIHFPFHDTNALSLTYKVISTVQPDMIVVGSDAFDLPNISRFETDRDIDIDDWLANIIPYWNGFINNIRLVAPNALLPFIVGNHDARALAEIKKLSVPRVVMEHFINVVRAENNVYWLGDTSEIELANLTVAHGWKTTRHTAAATLQAYQFQRNIAVGHTHRPDFYTVRGASYSVACVVGGCLCQLTPHYQQGRKHTDWQHGTMLGIVDTQAHDTHLHNLHYFTNWTTIGTQIIQL